MILNWLKRNGAWFALIVVKMFVKEHTLVGKLAKAIEEAEK